MHRIHDGLSVLTKRHTRIREPNLLTVPHEQLHAERLFQRFNLKGNRRLAHVQDARRLVVIKKVRQREKALQLPDPEVQRSALGSLVKPVRYYGYAS